MWRTVLWLDSHINLSIQKIQSEVLFMYTCLVLPPTPIHDSNVWETTLCIYLPLSATYPTNTSHGTASVIGRTIARKSAIIYQHLQVPAGSETQYYQ